MGAGLDSVLWRLYQWRYERWVSGLVVTCCVCECVLIHHHFSQNRFVINFYTPIQMIEMTHYISLLFDLDQWFIFILVFCFCSCLHVAVFVFLNFYAFKFNFIWYQIEINSIVFWSVQCSRKLSAQLANFWRSEYIHLQANSEITCSTENSDDDEDDDDKKN